MNELNNLSFEQIEKSFVNYLLKLTGPNTEQDKKRQDKYENLKRYLLEELKKDEKLSKYNFYIFSFGSFPFKIYHNESDIDITIVIQDKNTNLILYNDTNNEENYEKKKEFLIKVHLILKNYFINKNSNDNYIQDIISDKNNLVPLVKCKYESIAFDITVNNLDGLLKIIFMNYLEKNFLDSKFYKKTLILIKSWCYFQGSILGSNASLLGSYALECLVIYMFNYYKDSFNNEIEAFFKFFEIMKNIDWEKKIVSIYDLFDDEESFKIKDLLFSDKYQNENKINFKKIYNEILSKLERYKLNYKGKNENIIIQRDKKKMFILDPMYNVFNLAKSVNYHNSFRIKEILIDMNEECTKIKNLKLKNNCSKKKYLNSILKLFNRILSGHIPELFFENLPQPKMVILPTNKNDDFEESNEKIEKNAKEIANLMRFPILKEITNEQMLNDYNNFYVENVNYVTNEIVKFILDDVKIPEDKKYNYQSNQEIQEILNFEINAKI